MTERKWTEGPWTITNVGASKHGFFQHQIGTHEQTVAYTFEPGLKRDEQHANAHLITAAPALYEALDKLLRLTEFELGDNAAKQPWARHINRSHAALRKARGEDK